MTHTTPHQITRHTICLALLGGVVSIALWATPAAAKTPTGVELLAEIENVFVEIAEAVRNGVVQVEPLPGARSAGMGHGFGIPPGHPGTPPGNPHRPGPPGGFPPGTFPPGNFDDMPGNGAGVILDKAGNLVTNAHVIGSAKQMEIHLADGRHYLANVVGTDPATDLAVLRLLRPDGDDRPFPVLTLGDSDKVRPGQWTIAVGHPYGLNRTVTVGIVSGVGREGVQLTRYENFIQTDAPINPGNSGGPLFNIYGEVIGINTAILSQAQSIGFAIPSNMMFSVVRQLIDVGRVDRGWLGIGIQQIGTGLAAAFDVDENAGVLINEVFADQPAALSGLRPGDIITAVDGVAVRTPNTLARLIGNVRPDRNVHLKYLRDGVETAIGIKLGRRDTAPQILATAAPELPPHHDLGLILAPLTDELAQKYDADGSGLVVTEVNPDGLAARNGIRVGDVVREVNRTPVSTLDEVDAALTSGASPDAGESRVLLRTTRKGAGRYLVMEMTRESATAP